MNLGHVNPDDYSRVHLIKHAEEQQEIERSSGIVRHASVETAAERARRRASQQNVIQFRERKAG